MKVVFNFFKKIHKLFAILFLNFGYYIFGFLSKNENIWIVGAKDGFNDNSKYFYLQLKDELKNKLGINLYWIVKEKKFLKEVLSKTNGDAVYLYSFKGLKLSMRAKFYVSSYTLSEDLPYIFSKNSIALYLWHGIGVKNLKYKEKGKRIEWILNNKFARRFFPVYAVDPDFIVTPSLPMRKHFSDSFRIPIERCINSAYPRCSIISWSSNEIINFLNLNGYFSTISVVEEINKYEKTYLYMPTWRGYEKNFLCSEDFNWIEINEKLKKDKSLLILKVHPLSVMPNSVNFPNIIFLEKGFDIYPILNMCDYLITDYSSIYFDFLLKKSPKIFIYDYDYDVYEANSGGFAFDFHVNMYGLHIENMLNIFDSDHLFNDDYLEKINIIKEKFSAESDFNISIIENIQYLSNQENMLNQ